MTECQTSGQESAETNRIEIVVNGERREVPAGLTVKSLLAWLGLDGSRVAVELDRAIVRQPEWEKSAILKGAELEIVQFVGGG